MDTPTYRHIDTDEGLRLPWPMRPRELALYTYSHLPAMIASVGLLRVVAPLLHPGR